MPQKLDVTLPSDLEIRTVRAFDAPAQMIYDCHTKPALLQRWLLGPPGWTMPVCEIDLRVGGKYHFVWRSEADGSSFGMNGTYLEIKAPTLIVHSESMDGHEGKSLITWELTENGGKTVLSLTMKFESKEARDGALKSGMTDGMAMGYDRLDGLMKEAA